MSDLQDLLKREIEDVHAFIAAWFRGETEKSDEVFEARLAVRLDAALVNIQPSGRLLGRDDLIGGIYTGYASNPYFRIEISDVVVRANADDVALATYVEFQRGARNTVPADNTRVSTVLFGGIRKSKFPVWLHIHETGK